MSAGLVLLAATNMAKGESFRLLTCRCRRGMYSIAIQLNCSQLLSPSRGTVYFALAFSSRRNTRGAKSSIPFNSIFADYFTTESVSPSRNFLSSLNRGFASRQIEIQSHQPHSVNQRRNPTHFQYSSSNHSTPGVHT